MWPRVTALMSIIYDIEVRPRDREQISIAAGTGREIDNAHT